MEVKVINRSEYLQAKRVNMNMGIYLGQEIGRGRAEWRSNATPSPRKAIQSLI